MSFVAGIIGVHFAIIGFFERGQAWAHKKRIQLNLRSCGQGLSLGKRVWIEGADRISFGKNTALSHDAKLVAGGLKGDILIGDNFNCNTNVMISAGPFGAIRIGHNVLMGPNVVVRSDSHGFRRNDIPIRDQPHEGGDIAIGNDVWIAANVVVLPGVVIGDHSVIGAGSVVTSDVEPNSVYVGVPARKLKTRPIPPAAAASK